MTIMICNEMMKHIRGEYIFKEYRHKKDFRPARWCMDKENKLSRLYKLFDISMSKVITSKI
jgi:hypothetical protein